MPDSPAEAAGLQAGDIIMTFNGKVVEHSSELPYLVGNVSAGSKAKATIFREGSERTFTIEMANRPDDKQVAQQQANQNRLGMSVVSVPEDIAKQLDLEGGVMVDQIMGGAASRNGLQQGDVITMVNGQNVQGVEDFSEMAQAIGYLKQTMIAKEANKKCQRKVTHIGQAR